MAGFFDNNRNNFNTLQKKLNKINSNYEGLLIKNSQAIGYIEGELRKRSNMGGGDENDPFFETAVALGDTTSSYRTKVLSFYQLDYDVKVEKLRDMASNGEIEYVLDNITDDIIVYDENGYFCHPADIRKAIHKRKGISSFKDSYINEEQLMDEYTDSFEDVYSAWGFDNGISAWQFVYQYLIEGRLAFEIIYDNPTNPKRIIGFKELNAATLYPTVEQDQHGNAILSWLQRDMQSNNIRVLSDNQIIYLQYSSHHKTKRISFVERMVRSFNTLRTVEYSKVMWHLMYGAIRLKTKVPVGTKGYHRGRNDLESFKNTFKEDVTFNQDTGEVMVNGNPKIHYYKNYMIPQSKDGTGVDVETLELKGPDLQQDVLLQYFYKKLKIDSKLPFSRWDYDSGGGSYLQSPDSVTREEYEYSKFISRLRTGISELMTKPIYIQMCLNNPAIINDVKIKNAISISYVDEKIFERAKQAQTLQANAETISKLAELQNSDGGQVLDMDWMCKKFLNLTEDDWIENNEYKRKKIESVNKFSSNASQSLGGAQGAAGGSPDMSGGGGMDMGGAQMPQGQMGGQGQMPQGGQGQGQMGGQGQIPQGGQGQGQSQAPQTSQGGQGQQI